MAEILSDDEIKQIITAIEAEDKDENVYSRKIKIYDFKRPDKFSKENIRTISIMHESFARMITSFMSSHLRTMVHCHVASVDQLTYEEFIRSIPTPTCISVINMDPLRGNAALEIDPALTFSIIDLLAGGTGDNTKIQHELTEIEQSLMEEIFVRMLGCLRESWTNVIDLRPRLGCIETNPQFLQIVPPTEMVVLVSFEMHIGEIEGMINFCLPDSLLEPIMDKLRNSFWYQTLLEEKCVTSDLSKIKVPVIAEVVNKEFSLSKIKSFKKGELFKADALKLKANNSYFGRFEWMYDKTIKMVEIFKEKILMEKGNVSYSVGNLDDVKIKIIAELGRTELTINQLQNLGEGNTIELDKLAGEPVNIFANNILYAKGEVVVADENFGIRITEIINEQ